ncbi:MAG: hypothetical protein JW931_06145 [Methanomicrobiaceae archaeon]|nr:hypothetical protein [Methanomicrobiaceae archaeon]
MSNRALEEYWIHIAALIVILIIAAAVIFISTPNYLVKRPSDPVLKQDGSKWRIACYEAGDYREYVETLKYLAIELDEEGWIYGLDEDQLDSFSSTSEIWNYLGTEVKSSYLEFPAELFWSSAWNYSLREKNREDALSKMNSGQVDLLISLGTIAGKDVITDDNPVPVIIMASIDPVKAGLIRSVDDSGHDNVHTVIDSNQYRRQIEIFHDSTGFKTIGIGYDNSSPESISYSNIDLLREISKERDFEIIEYGTIDDNPDLTLSEESVIAAYTYLAPEVDAVYITQQNGVNPESVKRFLQPLKEYNVTTLSMDPYLVERGVLFSVVSGEPRFYAPVYVESIGMILNGAKPRSLEMKHSFPFRIMVNLDTAEDIGFEVPKGLLISADIVYCSPDTGGEVCV